jgi:hypothetical protein
MRTLPPNRHDQAQLSHTAKPVDIEPLLREVARRGWTLICCGPRHTQTPLPRSTEPQSWTDVVVLRGTLRAVMNNTTPQR